MGSRPEGAPAIDAPTRPALLLLGLALLGGCTARTLTVATEPPGADVYLDNRYVGTSPVTVDFRYGGPHEILALKAEHAAATVHYDTERFWLDTPPFDAFVDLGPFSARDHHRVDVPLERTDVRARWARDARGMRRGLRDRAEILRQRTRELRLQAPPREPLLPPEPEDAPADSGDLPTQDERRGDR